MAENQLVRLHVTIDGRVQAVGFRAFVVDMAEALQVTGWVRNTYGGQVEVTAEGQRENLEKLLDALRQGPRGAFVSDVQQDWQPATGEFTRFMVTRTF